MKNQGKQFLSAWEQATDDLAAYFANRYFSKDSERYWIGGDIGGVLQINDYFYDLVNIVDFLRYNYSRDKMFEYYDNRLEAQTKNKTFMNIKSWIKLN